MLRMIGGWAGRTAGLVVLWVVIGSGSLHATTYTLSRDSGDVVGELQWTRAEFQDTLLDVARSNGLGYQDIKLVNPDLDTWIPGSDKDILLPVKFILPRGPRQGLVLNIPEMRLYYFPDRTGNGPQQVITYPLGIGREGWQTPFVSTRIIDKKKHPEWRPPESIRKEHAEEGNPLPLVVKPGPDNPLGDYAMRLGIPSYLIHGTNKPYGVGMRVSHGCIRLYPEDIEELFSMVKLGTAVNIVNQPYKVGLRYDRIYLEAHPYLVEDLEQFSGNLTEVVKLLFDVTNENSYSIDWALARQVINEMKGVPVVIGQLTPGTGSAHHRGGSAAGIELRMDTSLPGPAGADPSSPD